MLRNQLRRSREQTVPDLSHWQTLLKKKEFIVLAQSLLESVSLIKRVLTEDVWSNYWVQY
jgi:hypothetical protein